MIEPGNGSSVCDLDHIEEQRRDYEHSVLTADQRRVPREKRSAELTWAIIREDQGICSGHDGGGVLWIDGFYAIRAMAAECLKYWDHIDSCFKHVLIEVRQCRPARGGSR